MTDKPSGKSRPKSRIVRTKPAQNGSSRKTTQAKPLAKTRIKPQPAPPVPAPQPDPEPEPEPLDPKAASRAIGKHIEKKKATRVLAQAALKPDADPSAKEGAKPQAKPPAKHKAETPLKPESAKAPEKAAAQARKPVPAPTPGKAAEQPVKQEAEPASKHRQVSPPRVMPPTTEPAERSAKAPPQAAQDSGRETGGDDAPLAAAPPCPPAPEPREDILKGFKVTDRDLIVIIDQSPESLSDEWLRIQAGDNAQPAVKISKVEAEFLLLKKTALE